VQEVDAAQGLVNYGPGFMNQHKVKPEKIRYLQKQGGQLPKKIMQSPNSKSLKPDIKKLLLVLSINLIQAKGYNIQQL